LIRSEDQSQRDQGDEELADGPDGGKGGSDSRNNLEGDARFGQGGHLLGGAAEDERVAAYETDDTTARATEETIRRYAGISAGSKTMTSAHL
jgi:hypothetical protein